MKHQVAYDVVAVYINFRLRQEGRQQGIDGLLPQPALFEIQFASQFLGDEPFRKQIDFAQHDLAVVLGQHAGAAGKLQFNQFAHGFEQQGFVCRFVFFLGHGGQKGGASQVVEHHKPLRFIDMQDLRHVDHMEEFLHFQIGGDTHFVRRGIHTDDGTAV